MKKSGLIKLLLALSLITLMVVVAACGKKADEEQTPNDGNTVSTKTLKLGVIMPFSGPASVWGSAIKKDMEVYAELINEDGGLQVGDDTYKIEMYYGDGEAAVEPAVNAARDLIDNKGVSAIVGYWTSALPSLANVLTPAKVILVATKPINYDPATMPYVAFSHTDPEIAIPQVSSALKHFPDTKALGISSDVFSYESLSPALAAVEEQVLKPKGITMFEATYAWDAMDFTQHVEKYVKAGVDTIYSWAAPNHEALIEKAIYEGGYKDKINFVGSGTLVDPKEYIQIAGYDAAQGSLHGYQAPWELKKTQVAPHILDMANRIRVRHEEKYNEELIYEGAFGYGVGSMALYFQALQKAGTIDPDAVMQEIDGGTFDMFIGTYTMSGKETYGRNVFAGTTGGMGVIEGEKPRLIQETPLQTIP